MDIRKRLPFEHCETCPEFILSVDDKVLFYGTQSSERVIDVRCKNETKCLRLNEMNKKEMNKNA